MPCIEVKDDRSGNIINDVYKKHNCICFYYWNDCNHCKLFKPVFNRTMIMIRGDDRLKNTFIFKIEYDNYRYLPEELRTVQAFPAIIAYRNGEQVDEFKDQRTEEKLSDFILNSSGEPSASYNGSLEKKSRSSSRIKKVIKQYYPKSSRV